MNAKFQKLFQESEIISQISCPQTPQQNGMAEHMHCTLLNIVRAMLVQANLSYQFWVEALDAAVHVSNRIPHASIRFNVPFEVLFYRKADVTGFRVYGCLCYVHITNPIPH